MNGNQHVLQWLTAWLCSLLPLKSVPGQDTHDHLTLPTITSVTHDGTAEGHAVGINVCGHDITSVHEDKRQRVSMMNAAYQLHINLYRTGCLKTGKPRRTEFI
jgi:hypothetical protein